MKHSNRQNREQEYAEKNREYLESKRAQLREIKGPDKEPEKKKSKGYCCLMVVVVVLLSLSLILYFIFKIKDVVIEDYLNKKQQIEQMIPEGKEEVKKSIEQGEDLFEETQATIENVQDKYEKAESFYQENKETLEKINQVKEEIEDVIN